RRRRRRRRRRCRRRIATAAATTECSRKRWWESRPTLGSPRRTGQNVGPRRRCRFTARRASLRLGLCPAAARALVGRAAFGDLNLALPQAVAVGKLRLAYVRLRALAEEDVPILPRAARPIDLVLLAKRLRYLSMSGVDSMRRMNKTSEGNKKFTRIPSGVTSEKPDGRTKFRRLSSGTATSGSSPSSPLGSS
ncbi:unnamed protein product, partial [Prorocentrum cordatum]